MDLDAGSTTRIQAQVDRGVGVGFAVGVVCVSILKPLKPYITIYKKNSPEARDSQFPVGDNNYLQN